MPRTRSARDIEAVFDLKAQGLTDRQVVLLTGVAVDTIRLWRKRQATPRIQRVLHPHDWCETCGGPRHQRAALPSSMYAYLFGVYLGDGCLTRRGGS